MQVELVSGQVAKMVHDDVQTPEHDLLLQVRLLLCLQISSYVVENTYQKPHPKVILSGLSLALPVVDRVFQKIFTYA